MKPIVILLAAVGMLLAQAKPPAASTTATAPVAHAPAVREVGADSRVGFYEGWGRLQALIAEYQRSLTAQQKSLQEEIQAQQDKVNKVIQDINTGKCGGHLDMAALQRENKIQCLDAPAESSQAQPKKE